MIRAVTSLLIILSVVACSGPLSSPPRSETSDGPSATSTGVIESLVALDGVLGSIEEPDIALAWSDLERDLRSLVDDAIHISDVSYFDGARDRVEAFRSRFSGHEEVDAAMEHWNRLVANLDDLRRRFSKEVSLNSSADPTLRPPRLQEGEGG